MGRSDTLADVGAAPRALTRSQRRRLAEIDRRSAQLAELDLIISVLQRARAVVSSGWLQRGWYRYRTAGGQVRTVAQRPSRPAGAEALTSACLVGAILEAGGGPAQARSQLVQRTLDLTWHVLREEPGRPVRWCPPPRERAARIGDLIGWNDRPETTQSDVSGLLAAAELAAQAEQARLRTR